MELPLIRLNNSLDEELYPRAASDGTLALHVHLQFNFAVHYMEITQLPLAISQRGMCTSFARDRV